MKGRLRWSRRAAPIVLLLLSAPVVGGCRNQVVAAPSPTETSVPIPTELVDAEAWIEVDLTAQQVVLHRNGDVAARFAAATGLMTYPEHRTLSGIYDIQVMQEGPIENVPGVFVRDVLIFDFGNGIGIHSRPMDAEGHLLDERLGLPITGGCVRVGDSAQVFDFARLGMPVWVH